MPGELVLQTLAHAWATLKDLKQPMAVTGGVALSAWEHIRSTQDVDIVIALEGIQLNDLIDRLKSAGFRPKHSYVSRPLGDVELVQMLYEPPEALMDIQVDFQIVDSPYELESLRHRGPAMFPGLDEPVDVLSCEDLILHKLNAGRILDLADAAALVRYNHERLDMAYLLAWRDRLQLQKSFAMIWDEALPGQSPPEIVP